MIVTCHCFFHPAKNLRSGAIVRFSDNSSFPLIIFDTISCPLYNLKTVKDFSMKPGTFVDHDETMCHAQEP